MSLLLGPWPESTATGAGCGSRAKLPAVLGGFQANSHVSAGWGDPPWLWTGERRDICQNVSEMGRATMVKRRFVGEDLSMRQTAFFINDPRHRSPGTRLRTRTGQRIWAGKRSAEAARRRGWKTCINRGPVFPVIPAAYSLSLTVCSTTGVDRRCRLPKGDEKCGW